jgi:hypothetical protein
LDSPREAIVDEDHAYELVVHCCMPYESSSPSLLAGTVAFIGIRATNRRR